MSNRSLHESCRPWSWLTFDVRQKMELAKRWWVLAVVAMASGCVTNDFKVLDALKPGMLPEEAQAAIRSYGFSPAKSLRRPVSGWPTERKTFDATDWRAGQEEIRSGKQVSVVEFYPVGHGLLGAGQLFLFYDDDGRLAHFYRYQIN